MTSKRRALVVGVNYYASQPLTGCVPDAEEMAKRLERHHNGDLNFDVKKCTASSAQDAISRGHLRNLLGQFFENSNGQDLLFYFSGHGRENPAGAELVTSDLDGVSLGELMALANGCAAQSVTIILDCCFSGDMGNTPGLQATQVAPDFRKGIASLSTGVTVFAASLSTEVSVEQGGHGRFTRLLLDGLDGAATDHLGGITALSLYAHASRAFGAWDQTPVLKSHISEAVVLRTGPKWVSPEDVRRLPAHFETAHTRISLTDAHEGEGRPYAAGLGTPEQQELDLLKRLRNVGLATTEDDQDFYFVTQTGGDVFLTSMGRTMWGLAKDGSV